MSAGHTPGPWINWDTLEWLIEPKRLLANSADARLIAAAPCLLEALERLYDHSMPTGPVGDVACAKALEVIRKTRGAA